MRSKRSSGADQARLSLERACKGKVPRASHCENRLTNGSISHHNGFGIEGPGGAAQLQRMLGDERRLQPCRACLPSRV